MNLPMESGSGLTRRSLIKLIGATTAAASLTATLAACGTTQNNPTQGASPTGSTAPSTTAAPQGPSGTITAGISYELGTNGYDPMTTTSALTVAANWHTMEGLTEIDPSGDRKAYAALAADLPKMVDDTHWEATLRDGAVFSDGTPVTVDDVVFSFARVLDKANKSLYASFLPFIEKVEGKDDKTVTITTKYAFSLVAERLAVVKIVPKALVEKDAKAFDLNPVGTGPYKMTDNGAASQQVVFEANAKYNGPRPARAEKMLWQVLPDASTRTNALTSDTVQAIDSVPAADIATLAATKKVAAEQGFGLVFVMFNQGAAPMNDVKNRQGVMWAIDVAKVCSVGMSDLATPATSFLQKEHPNYHEAKAVYTQNLEKAKALFAETGLKSVRLLASNHDFFAAARPIIKESLEAAGLSVSYEEKKSADVYGTIDGKVDAYDIVIAPGDPSVFGADADLLLRWWYAGDTWTDSRMHWKGQPTYTQVQDLLTKGAEATGTAQQDAWNQVFDIVSEDLPLYPLFHRKTPTAWNGETLVDFKPIAVTGLSFEGVGTTK